MKRSLLILLVLLVLGLPGSAQTDWVSNEFCALRVTDVVEASSLAEFKALDWSEQLDPERKGRFFDFANKQYFSRGFRIFYIRFELKNLTSRPVKVGHVRPWWTLRISHGRKTYLARILSIAEFLMISDGLPKLTEVQPQQTIGGFIPFAVFKGQIPTELFYVCRHCDDDKSFGDPIYINLWKFVERG